MIAIYVRVSTEEQSTKGYSIGNQIDECKNKAGTNEVLTYADEGISGEILERPALTKLREDIANGLVNELVCYDPDRLSRKLMHQLMLDEEFRKKGVILKFVNGEYAQTAEGQLFFSMRGAIAEFEKEKIKQRTKGGKIKKAKTGKVIGNYHLYGYDWDHGKDTYKINEEQAKVVQMIFNYFTDQTSPFKGINGIANHLTEIGIPTAKNKPIWHRQVVRQILMNISYTGKHPHNRYDTEGDYVRKQSGGKSHQTIRPEEEWIFVDIPPIISMEQFNMAQDILAQSRRRFAKESVNQYLLSGLLRCKDCKNTMTGRHQNWWGDKKFTYSDIKNTAGAKNKGCGNVVQMTEIDDVVWNEVLDILNNPEKIMEYKEQTKESKFLLDELQHIDKELDKNKKGRKRLVTLAAMNEDIDLSDINDQIKELQTKGNTLQNKYNQIQQELKELGTDNSEEKMKYAIELRMKYREKDFTFEAKKEVIRALVKQIYISKNEELEIHLF